MIVAKSFAVAVVVALATATLAVAQTPSLQTTTKPAEPNKQTKLAKPKVPIGVDPGGVPVAFIGPGLDYTQPDIAENLARDGEGELIGFDLNSEDRKPFAKQDAPADHETLMSFANALLSQAVDIKLQVFKTTNRDTKMIARAIQMAVQAKARIIVIWAPPVVDTHPNITRDDAFLKAAMTRFPTIAFLAGPILPNQPEPAPDSSPIEPGDVLPHEAANKMVKSLRAMELILRSKPDALASELAAAQEP